MNDIVQDIVPVVQEHEGKIKCPQCRDGWLTSVLDSRASSTLGHPTIRRRRICTSCHNRTSTYEITADVFEKLFTRQTAKLSMAMRILDIIDGEVREEIVRRLSGSPDGAVITPRDEDID